MTQRLRLMWHAAPAVLTLGMGPAACEGCRSTPAPAAPTAAASGPEAGAPTARLYLLTDLAGALEPCGCTKDQLGGLGHFGAWVKRATIPGLVAAAGPVFFMDPSPDPQRADQDASKADAIARVLGQIEFAAFAPAVNDWAEGVGALAKLAHESGATAIAVANAQDSSLAPSTVRALSGTALRIGFVGYGQPPAGGASGDVEGTVEADVRRGVERAKAQGANVLIALVATGRGEAKRIAEAIPELTAVVVGSTKSEGEANSTAPDPERVGDVLIAQSANHLQNVVVLDMYVRGPVAPGRVLHFTDATGAEAQEQQRDLDGRITDLRTKIAAWERDPGVNANDLAARRRDFAKLEAERRELDRGVAPPAGSFIRYRLEDVRDTLGADPTIDAEIGRYYRVVDERNRAAFANRLPPPARPGEATYVGVDACTSCHPGARRVWDGTEHARAYATLSAQFKEFNLDCVPCHVTGYERPGGSTVTHVDGLRNVQCEACHGPGSRHVADPDVAAAIIARPPASTCLGCHHPPHVEHFDAAAKLSEILGPGHGRRQR